MRDVLIHDYIGVDLDEVWNVASSRIPELQALLEQFLAGEGAGRCHPRDREVPLMREGRRSFVYRSQHSRFHQLPNAGRDLDEHLGLRFSGLVDCG